MVIHLACIIDINQGELADANNGEHENQEQEQQAKRGHGWRSREKRLEDLLELFCFLDQPKDPTDSQRSKNGSEDLKVFSNTSPCNA